MRKIEKKHSHTVLANVLFLPFKTAMHTYNVPVTTTANLLI